MNQFRFILSRRLRVNAFLYFGQPEKQAPIV